MTAQLQLVASQTRAMQVLSALAQEPDAEERWRLAADFLAVAYAISRALNQTPELRESPEYRQFISESSRYLNETGYRGIDSYCSIQMNDFYGLWDDEKWFRLCSFRSEIQSMIDLYAETEVPPLLSVAERSELDDYIRERATYSAAIARDQIPAGTPNSHRWWGLKLPQNPQ